MKDLTLQRLNGRRLLRFTTIVVNRGPGHFEVRGRRPSTSVKTMHIRQVIFDSAGGSRHIRTGATAQYAGDGHDHWHVRNVTSYELWRAGDRSEARRGEKIGLCFFDTMPWRLGLPGARQSPYYREAGCAKSRGALTIRAGISVGWGDNYPWYFAYQWIDVTGLPGGRYMLRTTVDQPNFYLEEHDLNNCVWVKVRIPDPGAGSKVRVRDSGAGCSRDSTTPVDTFPEAATYDPPKRIRIEAGTHLGIKVNSLATVLRRKRLTLTDAITAWTIRRATIPGRDGKWFYVTSGRWAGYWLRDTSKVNPVS